MSVANRIAAALAPSPTEQADWLTLDEANAIIAEASAANDPVADALVDALVSRALPADPHTNAGIDRKHRMAPPAGKVWADDAARTYHPYELGSAMRVLNDYLVERNTTNGPKYLGNLYFAHVREALAGKVFTVAPGASISFDLPDSLVNVRRNLPTSPAGIVMRSGRKTGYTPQYLPIYRRTLTVPPSAVSGTEYTVRHDHGLSFTVRVA